MPLNAAFGSGVSAASAICAIAAVAGEVGAETAQGNANTNAFLPQMTQSKAERNQRKEIAQGLRDRMSQR